MRGLGFDSRRTSAASLLGLHDGSYDVSLTVCGGLIEIIDIEVTSAPWDDCGFDTLDPAGSEWYMATHATWEPVAADAKFLCVACLEERLGRRLTPTDFSGFAINESSILDSRRLADRKGH